LHERRLADSTVTRNGDGLHSAARDAPEAVEQDPLVRRAPAKLLRRLESIDRVATGERERLEAATGRERREAYLEIR
jgi:hypothetical protein